MKTLIPAQRTLSNPFYRTIERIMSTNEIVIFNKIVEITPSQEQAVLTLLKSKYEIEQLDYPNVAPFFDEAAALWSSKVLFNTAQLVMHRDLEIDNVKDRLPDFTNSRTASAILTADLSLRYLPSVLEYLERIDVEDGIIPILNKILKEWHYSGLKSKVDLGIPDFDRAFVNPCLMQMYVNRVIEYKQKEIGHLDGIKSKVLSALGDYKQVFWKEFNLTI